MDHNQLRNVYGRTSSSSGFNLKSGIEHCLRISGIDEKHFSLKEDQDGSGWSIIFQPEANYIMSNNRTVDQIVKSIADSIAQNTPGGIAPRLSYSFAQRTESKVRGDQEFLELKRKNMEILGFYDEARRSHLVTALELTYKPEIIKYWSINSDSIVLDGNKVLFKWIKRMVSLTDKDLSEMYGKPVITQ